MTAARIVSDLADRRRSLGLTQADIAREMGTGASAVSEIESGRRELRLSTACRYAAVLGADLILTVKEATR